MREFILLYLIIINLIAIVITVHDKHAAVKHRWRVPESTLLIVAALSGCVVMYITMHIIHHKTRKKRFMVGIPVIFVTEVIVALLICRLGVF